MKNPETAASGRVERIAKQMSANELYVLYQLNGESDRTHFGSSELYMREPVLRRTRNGAHYRMRPQLAKLLMADVAEPADGYKTCPPTALVTVEETLGKLCEYIGRAADHGVEPGDIAGGIREALGMPVRPDWKKFY